MTVTLEPISADNVGDVFDLTVAPEQEGHVASNAWSLAQALAEDEIAWPRAITAEGAVVGFLMLEIDPEEENGRHHWLWRLMVDREHQRRGHGRAALRCAIEELRRMGANELWTSWVPGPDGPEGFYLRLGFVKTGEVDDGEDVARLDLTTAAL